jgi:hypothetical protein
MTTTNLQTLSNRDLVSLQEELGEELERRRCKVVEENAVKMKADPILRALRDEYLSLRAEYEKNQPPSLARSLNVRFDLKVGCATNENGVGKFLRWGGYALAHMFDLTAYISVEQSEWIPDDLREELENALSEWFSGIADQDLLAMFDNSAQVIDFSKRCHQLYQNLLETTTDGNPVENVIDDNLWSH